MLEFLTLKPEAFGLDISDLSLKIVKLKKRGNFFTLSSYGKEEIEPGIIKRGEIKDEKKLAEIIRESIKKVRGEKLKTKNQRRRVEEEGLRVVNSFSPGRTRKGDGTGGIRDC